MNYHIEKKIVIVSDEFESAYTFSNVDEFGTIMMTDDDDLMTRTIYITQDVLPLIIDVLTELKQPPKD